MTSPKIIPSPVEYCRPSHEYPVYVHIFHRTDIKKEDIIPRHWHTNIEMTYRIKYRGAIIIDGQQYPLTDDSLFIINSRSIHEIHTFPQEELLAVLVSIPYEFIKSLVPEVELYHFVCGKNEENIKRTILKMKEIEELHGDNAYLRMYSLAVELIYYMMEDAEPVAVHQGGRLTGHDMLLTSTILTCLREKICDIHSVEEMSTVLGYSREHLSRFVTRNFGISCKNLIDQVRLDYTVFLMKNSKDTLTEIAEKAGFSSYRTFRTIFRKYYGVKPEMFMVSGTVKKT